MLQLHLIHLMIFSKAITLSVKAKNNVTFLAKNDTLRWILFVDYYLTILCLPTTPNTCFPPFLNPRKMVARNKSIG